MSSGISGKSLRAMLLPTICGICHGLAAKDKRESVLLIALLKLVHGDGVGPFLYLTTPLPVQVATKVPQGHKVP